MSSSYQLCPALKLDDGYLAIRRVEKAYPVFLRCAAAYLPPRGEALEQALDNLELFPTLADFSAAAARLVSQPMLQPFGGGVPVLVYVARPGKEALFLEFADGLDQADDYTLLKILPAVGSPMALVFGDPSVPLGEPSSAGPAAVGLKAGAPVDAAPAKLPVSAGESPPPVDEVPLLAPDLQPLPVPPSQPNTPAPLLDEGALPPVEVVVVTTSALDDLLGPSMAARNSAAQPAGEAEAPAAYDASSEPALETLLRQAPRLQAPETGPPPPPIGEPGRGPAPEEMLTAVKQAINTLAEAQRRQAAEQQGALQAAMAGAEQAAHQQGRALEARQTEQWDRQQAALRQMQSEQTAAIQSALTRLDEERAAWQQRALRELQPVSAQQWPGALRQLQDDLTKSQQLALQQLRDDLRRQPPAIVAPPAAPSAAPVQPAPTVDLQELNWQLEKAAVATQDLRQRVGQLLWVNLLLLLALIGLAAAAAWAFWGNAPSPAPTPTAAFTATLLPATSVPPTQAPPTPDQRPAAATTSPSPTAAATALPVFVAALTCANADRPRNFYECSLTNSALVTDTLSLAVQAADNELNGFQPAVSRDNQERIQPDSVTGLFVVGEFAPGETRPVRISLPCAVATGCGVTTFAITPLVRGGQTIVADQIVNVTTHYFPPAGTVTP